MMASDLMLKSRLRTWLSLRSTERQGLQLSHLLLKTRGNSPRMLRPTSYCKCSLDILSSLITNPPMPKDHQVLNSRPSTWPSLRSTGKQELLPSQLLLATQGNSPLACCTLQYAANEPEAFCQALPQMLTCPMIMSC